MMMAALGRRVVAVAAALSCVVGVGPAVAADRISMERVPLTAPARQVPLLASLGLDVTEDVTPTSAVVVAHSDQDRAALRDAGFAPVTLIRDYGARPSGARPRAVGPPATSTLPSGRTSYRTADEVQADLDTLVAAHPGLVRKVVLPRRSVQGRPITGVEIAANVNRADDGRPVYVVMGLHHAREWPSAEIATEFALDLVAHQSQTRIAALLAGERILVIPVVNPDGYAYSRGGQPAGQSDANAAVKRRNCRALAGDPATAGCAAHRGVDLNRDYGAYWGGLGASTSPDDDTFRGAGPWSEPETAAVHELTRRLPVTGVQSLHNVAGLILRPPGFRALGLAPDEARLKALGDAMGAATGYPSHYGYALYEVTGASEDWNYVAQGAFGYTIETAGAFPGDPDFHGPYQTHVVDQYLGGGASPGPVGQGVREALLLAAAEAMDPHDHIVLRGRAPAGTTLRLHKSFQTASSPLCSDTLSADACGPTTAAIQTPDGLDTMLTAPGGSFRWHAGPSTRPFVRKRGGRETWTLRCERHGRVVAVKAVFADRGQIVDVDPCDVLSLPRRGVVTGAARTARVAVRVPAQTAAGALRGRRVILDLRCPVACRVSVVLRSGATVIGRRGDAVLAPRRPRGVRVPLTGAARALVARSSRSRRLSAQIVLRTRTGSATTVRRVIVLRGG